MKNIKLIAMDLDGTLTQHKTPLSECHRAVLDALSKKYKRAGGDNSQLKDASLSVVICFVLSSIIAIIVSAFKLNIDMNIFLRLLISLGLNVIPFVFAGFLALFLEDA